MKNILLILVSVFCLTFGAMSIASAADVGTDKVGMYIEPKIGMGINLGQYLNTEGISRNSSSSSNASLNGALAVGYNFKHNFDVPIRVEGEYGIRTTTHFKVRGLDVKVFSPQTLFANVYWDFYNSTDFVPYVGGGIGASFIGGNANTNFAWNAGAGVGYTINEDWTATLGYKFVGLGEFKENHTKGNLYSHDVTLGVRYTF